MLICCRPTVPRHDPLLPLVRSIPRQLLNATSITDQPHQNRGFSYGLLDTLNKHFQNTLGITQARSSGLQAAYFGAYPLASLGHANWLLRHYGFKIVFIWGLCLYGIGALVAWPCLLHRSFGGFCAAIFIIGNGLGSLESKFNLHEICGVLVSVEDVQAISRNLRDTTARMGVLRAWSYLESWG